MVYLYKRNGGLPGTLHSEMSFSTGQLRQLTVKNSLAQKSVQRSPPPLSIDLGLVRPPFGTPYPRIGTRSERRLSLYFMSPDGGVGERGRRFSIYQTCGIIIGLQGRAHRSRIARQLGRPPCVSSFLGDVGKIACVGSRLPTFFYPCSLSLFIFYFLRCKFAI